MNFEESFAAPDFYEIWPYVVRLKRGFKLADVQDWLYNIPDHEMLLLKQRTPFGEMYYCGGAGFKHEKDAILFKLKFG